MAEFLTDMTGTRIGPRPSDEITDQGMGAMGHPIPMHRRAAADWHLKDMGVTCASKRTACIGAVADRLERDEPYEAFREGMRYLDLTGTYRLIAALLVGEPDEVPTTEQQVATASMSFAELEAREKAAEDRVRKAKAEVSAAKRRSKRLAQEAHKYISDKLVEIEDEVERRVQQRLSEITIGIPYQSDGGRKIRLTESVDG